ncbi:MAG TPA: hypothetical protein VFV99_02125 [Kofleriaceae bacterium]|nr:hypothetical protein [Kofleriaceae bacterium]
MLAFAGWRAAPGARLAKRACAALSHRVENFSPHALRQASERWEDHLFLAREVWRKVALQSIHDARELACDCGNLSRIGDQSLADRNQRRHERLVGSVLAGHQHERRSGCLVIRETRRDLFVLVGDVHRQRFREVAPDLRRNVADLVGRNVGGSGQCPRHREEPADALVAFEQELDDIAGLGTLTDLYEHGLVLERCSDYAGTIRAPQ